MIPEKRRIKDEQGKRYNKLTILGFDHFDEARRQAHWKCRCDCGNEVIVEGSRFRSGHTKSCGCHKRHTLVDLLGLRFNKLTVIEYLGKAKWRCLCDCGNETTVRGGALRSGFTGSCGCSYSRLGDRHPCWKGGKPNRAGYVIQYMPEHPRNNRRYVYEHILVMEKMLGRYVESGEVVHHCNGDKTDNRPYNLRLFPSAAEHTAYHHKMRSVING